MALPADPVTIAVIDRGPVSPEAVRWAAEQVIRMHTEAPPHTLTPWAEMPLCARCEADRTCALLAWARAATAAT